MANVLPRDLTETPGGIVNPNAAAIVDDGSGVWKATPEQIVDAGAPVNSQAEAEAGVVDTGRMTPLRVSQAIDALGVSQAVLASSSGGGMVGMDDGSTAQETTKALAFGTFDDASSANVPTNIGAVDTRGYTDEGFGGARYYYDAAVDATYVSNNPRSAFISTNGRGFKLGEREPTADMFGALADDGTGSPPDATAALNYLGAYFEELSATDQWAFGSGEFRLPPGLTYRISGSLYLPWFLRGVLNGATIKPVSGTALSAFDNDSMICINVDSSGNQIKPAGGYMANRLENFALLNDDSDLVPLSTTTLVSGLKGVYSKGRTGLHNVFTSGLWQTYVKDGSAGSEYIDNIELSKLLIYRAQGTEYPIEISAYGDNLLISQISFQQQPTNPKGIYARYCRGGMLDGIIGGQHLIERSHALDLRAVHIENGSLELKSCGGTVQNGYFWHKDGVTPLTVSMVDTARLPPPLRLSEIGFIYPDEQDETYSSERIDVNIDRRAAVNVENVYRAFYGNDDAAITSTTAARVAMDGTLMTQFEQVPSWNARQSVISAATVSPTIRSQPVPSSVGNLAVNTGSTQSTWHEASATYFWKAAILYGPPDRLCGRVAGTEPTGALTNGGNGALLTLTTTLSTNPSFSAQTTMLLRGTATGVYSKKVLIPNMGAVSFFDTGYSMGNGERWVDLGGSTVGVPTLNAVTEIRLVGESNVEAKGTAAPTVGTWKVGDRIINSAPSADGNNMVLVSWTCTTAGTPGTWTPQYVSSVSPAT